MHSKLLSKGFALCQPPTINQALEGNMPYSYQSNERSFLRDFVACTPGTSGGRLAAWVVFFIFFKLQVYFVCYNASSMHFTHVLVCEAELISEWKLCKCWYILDFNITLTWKYSCRWLQPDSYLDPRKCEILYNKEELRCGWPTVITVQTKDQYGQLINVPNLKVCNWHNIIISVCSLD